MAADRTPYHKVNDLLIGYVCDISLFGPYMFLHSSSTLKVSVSFITVLPKMQ